MREINNLKNYFDPANNPKKIKKGKNLAEKHKTKMTLTNLKSRRGRKKKIAPEMSNNSNNNIESKNNFPNSSYVSITKGEKFINLII